MSADKLKGEIENSAAAMKQAYGRPPMLLRPPYVSRSAPELWAVVDAWPRPGKPKDNAA